MGKIMAQGRGLASELNDGVTAQGQVIPGEFGKC